LVLQIPNGLWQILGKSRYTLEELSRTCEDCGQKLVSLFKTRVDMTQWIAWLNQPEKPAGQSGKVVHLKKPH
jgi:hypothetical protein